MDGPTDTGVHRDIASLVTEILVVVTREGGAD